MAGRASRQAIIVVDLAFGDCGKGTIVDYLTRARGADTIIRFNGGPQAAHNVVASDGRHHTFSQFGSGMFLPGVRTILSKYMLIEPYALLNEAAHLDEIGIPNAVSRLLIDARCVVITPAQQATNRLRELARGPTAHGTCGVGLGEAVYDSLEHPDLTLFAADLADRHVVARKLKAVCDLKKQQLVDVISALSNTPLAERDISALLDTCWIPTAMETYAHLAAHATILDEEGIRAAFDSARTMIFEGAQGVLLDELHGFQPHTTWSNTTFANANSLLYDYAPDVPSTRLGVLRSYFTRHGRGPLVTECSDLAGVLCEPHNDSDGWPGRFRVGLFDAVAVRYAVAVSGGVDQLAVTHLDRIQALPPKICHSYSLMQEIPTNNRSQTQEQERLTRELFACQPVYERLECADSKQFIAGIENAVSVKVGIGSVGTTANDKYEL